MLNSSRLVFLQVLAEGPRPGSFSPYAPEGAKKAVEAAKKVTFNFRTKGMEALWSEIRGQITDGYWENKHPGYGKLYWGWMNTGIAGKTIVKGALPNAVKNYPLKDLIKTNVSGRMLATLQQHEPGADLETLKSYLDEIAKAMKAAKREAIRAPKLDKQASDRDKIDHELRWKFGLKDTARQVFSKILVGQGSRGGQYHYFAIYQDPTSGEFIGGNAYGRFGKPPKSVELARGTDMSKVQKKVDAKIRTKTGKYMPESIEDLVAFGRALAEGHEPELLWRVLDTEDLIRQRNEQTSSANVGAFAVPLGTSILRRPLKDLVGRSPARRAGHTQPHMGGYEDAFDWLHRKGR